MGRLVFPGFPRGDKFSKEIMEENGLVWNHRQSGHPRSRRGLTFDYLGLVKNGKKPGNALDQYVTKTQSVEVLHGLRRGTPSTSFFFLVGLEFI